MAQTARQVYDNHMDIHILWTATWWLKKELAQLWPNLVVTYSSLKEEEKIDLLDPSSLVLYVGIILQKDLCIYLKKQNR